MTLFLLEDDFHAEWKGKFESYDEALAQLKRLSTLPWDAKENRCPCTSWRTCHRDYHIIEYDDSKGTPWRKVKAWGYLEVSSTGTAWTGDWAPEA